MPVWIACPEGFIAAVVIRWREGVWSRRGPGKGRAVKIGIGMWWPRFSKAPTLRASTCCWCGIAGCLVNSRSAVSSQLARKSAARATRSCAVSLKGCAGTTRRQGSLSQAPLWGRRPSRHGQNGRRNCSSGNDACSEPSPLAETARLKDRPASCTPPLSPFDLSPRTKLGDQNDLSTGCGS